jgi:hypothetical protein
MANPAHHPPMARMDIHEGDERANSWKQGESDGKIISVQEGGTEQ